MTDYLPIANSEVDANSPITETLMTRMRDNPIAQFERAPGAPVWGATVDVAGSNANGYYRIWSDGFIQCWSDGDSVLSAGATTVHTFPVQYTNSDSITVNIMDVNRNDASRNVGLESPPSTVSFTASNSGGGSTKTYRWSSQGY